MNKLKNLFLLGLVALGSATMTSCEKGTDGDGNGGTNAPNLVLDNNGFIGTDADVSTNASLSFKVVATSNSSSKSKLKRLHVTRTMNNNSVDVLDTTLNTDNLAKVITANASGTAGTEKFKFEITDNDGQSASTSITITTGTPFSESDTVYFSNINGPEKGAFDLIIGASISTTSSTNNDSRDMQNTNTVGTTFTGSWSSSSQASSTRTLFVKAGGTFNYNSASNTSAGLEYGLGSNTPTVSNPSAGDVYIARLRGTANYAVIKVTKVDATAGSGTNKGRLYFVFKK